VKKVIGFSENFCTNLVLCLLRKHARLDYCQVTRNGSLDSMSICSPGQGFEGGVGFCYLIIRNVYVIEANENKKVD